MKLLLGQLEPDEGSIRYGGVALGELKKTKLYEKLAYIGQDAKLFQESVAENLRMGKPDASAEELEEACKKACIYEFVQALPEGFDTKIGENGAMLSGGQRQRILLARAFLRDADLYVFDEATSALDGQVEEVLLKTINAIPKDKTVILVAHKEKLLALCDRVIRLA